MRLSYKHKFVYIAIGKSGSSSIREALGEYSCIEYWGSDPEKSEYIHTNLRDVKKIFSFTDSEFDSYFKFSFVRNPWSRVVSYWNYINQCKISYLKNNHHPYFGPVCIKILKECEQDFSLFIKLWNWHLPSFFDMLAKGDGTLLADFVGKLENVQEDFTKLEFHNNNFHIKTNQNTSTILNTTTMKLVKSLRKNMQKILSISDTNLDNESFNNIIIL